MCPTLFARIDMNESHLQFLSSPEWAQMLRENLLPWIEAVGDLGDDVLEIGPGPGLTTDLLRERVRRLTVIEVDAPLATRLRERLAGTNVEVLCSDAVASELPAGRFSAATCFSVLHHMPSPEHRDRLFAEAHRVLRPDGVFLGVDALDLDFLRQAHLDDVFVPVDPDTLPSRLEAKGFRAVDIDVADYEFRFTAKKTL